MTFNIIVSRDSSGHLRRIILPERMYPSYDLLIFYCSFYEKIDDVISEVTQRVYEFYENKDMSYI